ncbi:MAG TPA: hypothetical protein PLY95_01210 [Candidatus Paceibacterota bacterium]|nr:hypothetical protein [Candidatus Paceibacterota bacterium]HQI25856.1 hypothetical protein [Candidatus Paceibacterota bacterium]HQJ84093.1 hypothetical protein [Candidatus Paceibacterota bacterium]
MNIIVLKSLFVSVSFLLVFTLGATQVCFAQAPNDIDLLINPAGGGSLDTPMNPANGGNTELPMSPQSEGIFTNPLKDGIDSLPGLLKLVLDIMVQIGTTVIIIMIIYAGFLYTTAMGNQSKLDKAHKVIQGVLIGSAIILGAFVIAQVIKDTADDLIEGVMIEQNIV